MSENTTQTTNEFSRPPDYTTPQQKPFSLVQWIAEKQRKASGTKGAR